jgi:hypothetical protein
MRPLRARPVSRRVLGRILLAAPVVPALAVAAACGGSTSNPPAADSGTDSGVAPQDGSSVVPDTGTVTMVDAGKAVDAAPAPDSGPVNDGGACPSVNAPVTEATHGKPPAMDNFGGPVLSSPLVVSFTFQNTANAAAVQAFGATIGSTTWFAETLKDYTTTSTTPAGLGVSIAANADATYVDDGFAGSDAGAGAGTDLNGFINQAIANAVAAKTIPAPDGTAVYMFYFPSTTTISAFGAQSCQAFGGYHFNQLYTDGKTPIYYAILPDCYAGTPYELEGVTLDGSHELDEAVSDPTPNTGWSIDVTSYPDAGTTAPEYRDDPWLTLGYGEIADNCSGMPWSLGDDAGTVVQRIWSNAAANGGHDPCIPVPAGEQYFNASTDKAIYVANVGDTFTIDVTAFTDVPRASWQLDAVDTSGQATMAGGAAGTSFLKFEWVGGVVRSDGIASLTCVNNGSTAQVKVTLLAAPTIMTTPEDSPQSWPQVVGSIYSLDLSQQTAQEPGQNTATWQWPFEVITPAVAAQIGVGSSGVPGMRRGPRFRHPVWRGR